MVLVLLMVEGKVKEIGLEKDSTILLNQIRTLDKKRIIKVIAQLENKTMFKVNTAIKINLGI